MKKHRLSLSVYLIVPAIAVFALLASTVSAVTTLTFRNNLYSYSENNSQTTSEQLVLNYESYFGSAMDSANAAVNTYANIVSADSIEEEMSSFFDSLILIRAEVITVALYKVSDGSLLAAASNYAGGDATYGEDYFFTESVDNPYIPVFASASHEGVAYSFCLSRYVNYDRDASYNAVLRVDCDFSLAFSAVTPESLGEGGGVVIYDGNYDVYYASEPNLGSDEAMAILSELVLGSTQGHFAGHDYFVYCSTISQTAWRMGIFLNADAIGSAIASVTLVAVLMAVLSALLFALAIFFIVRGTTKSLVALRNEMAMTASLDVMPERTKEIKGPKEVSELQSNYFTMMRRIKELVDTIEVERDEQRKSELVALQNQINPHFLYNTLDSIIGLIEKGENKKAEAMIVSLSRFFRISISRGHNIIPVEDELEHVRHYLLIQKMRFEDAFDFKIEKGEGLEGLYVNKLILQPIVENCLNHALKEEEVTFISVKAYQNDGFLCFDIDDDGYGMSEETLQNLRSSLTGAKKEGIGVGVRNVYLRIKGYYGEKATLEIDSEEDYFTRVRIRIPLEGARKHEE